MNKLIIRKPILSKKGESNNKQSSEPKCDDVTFNPYELCPDWDKLCPQDRKVVFKWFSDRGSDKHLQSSSWEDRFEKMFRELKAVTPDIIKTFIKDELSAQQQEWKEKYEKEAKPQIIKAVVEYEKQFKEELRKKIEKKLKEMEMKEIPSNIAIYKHQDYAYKAGWNNALLVFEVHGLSEVLAILK